MRAFFILWRKELGSYFSSPIAYVTSVFFLAVMGFSFWLLVDFLVEQPGSPGAMQALFDSFFFWVALLVVVPVITMRSFAEEKRSGTIEVLMTAPVTDPAVVLAKFAGALGFFAAMWTPTALYALLLQRLAPLPVSLDAGPLLGGYLGALLIGAFYISIGVFASSLTSNQIIAAIVAFAAFGLFFFAGLLTFSVRDPALREVAAYFSALSHMSEFARGAVDSRPVVLYLTGTAFMLFATVRVVESRKWK